MSLSWSLSKLIRRRSERCNDIGKTLCTQRHHCILLRVAAQDLRALSGPNRVRQDRLLQMRFHESRYVKTCGCIRTEHLVCLAVRNLVSIRHNVLRSTTGMPADACYRKAVSRGDSLTQSFCRGRQHRLWISQKQLASASKTAITGRSTLHLDMGTVSCSLNDSTLTCACCLRHQLQVEQQWPVLQKTKSMTLT